MLLQAAIFFHLLSAMFWIGGMLFLVLVLVPFLRAIPDPAKKMEIYNIVGTRFSIISWVAIGIIIITGLIILNTMYGLSPASLLNPASYTDPFGKALLAKFIILALIIIISVAHDFWIGPLAVHRPELAGAARIIGRVNFVLALIILLLAVLVRMGGI